MSPFGIVGHLIHSEKNNWISRTEIIFNSTTEKLDIKTIERLQESEKELCIDWKSELQLEWSQHLWRFFGDLHLLRKQINKESKKKLEQFVKRRYSEPLSQQILDE